MTSPDPVAKSDRLDEKLASDPVVGNLVKIVNQHKTLLRWLIFTTVLSLSLSVAVMWLAFKAGDTAATANSAATQARIVCSAANDLRASERQLWNFILTLPPPPNETPADKARRLQQTESFRAYVKKHFAPRHCAAPAQAEKLPTSHPQPSPRAAPAPSTSPPTVYASSRSPVPQASSPTGGSSFHPKAPHISSPSPSPSSSPSSSPSPRLCVKHLICIPPGSTLTPHHTSWRLAWVILLMTVTTSTT